VRPERVLLNVAEEAVAAFPGGKVMKIVLAVVIRVDLQQLTNEKFHLRDSSLK
jgi:hypothetical protein